MNANAIALTDVSEEARSFRDQFMTLQLASSDEAGTPTASYAPFAKLNDNFVIYVSELAAHTKNLTSGRDVSVLFIESETQAAHLFARRRLTVTCTPNHIRRDTEDFNLVMATLREQFGEFIDHMKTLKDFHAIVLKPNHASYVRGFAQAYEFQEADFTQVRHINDRGHRDD